VATGRLPAGRVLHFTLHGLVSIREGGGVEGKCACSGWEEGEWFGGLGTEVRFALESSGCSGFGLSSGQLDHGWLLSWILRLPYAADLLAYRIGHERDQRRAFGLRDQTDESPRVKRPTSELLSFARLPQSIIAAFSPLSGVILRLGTSTSILTDTPRQLPEAPVNSGEVIGHDLSGEGHWCAEECWMRRDAVPNNENMRVLLTCRSSRGAKA
jgi:hypothetical protein